MSTNEPLLVARPSWWNYWGWLLFCWLLIPFGVAWWKRRGLTLTILPVLNPNANSSHAV